MWGYTTGEQVKWVSRAKGSRKEHQGTVIALIPAGESAAQYLPADAAPKAFIGTDTAGKDRILVQEGDRYYTPFLRPKQ